MAFRSPIFSGPTLVRAAIQSNPFVSGSTGWQLQRNGNAEFNNAIFRGTVVVENNQAVLLYSATPALGNLVGSFSPAGGTDSVGNTYPTGFMFTNGTLKFAATVETFLGNLVPLIQLFTGGGSEEVPFHIASAVFGSAGVGAGRFYDTKIVSAANTNTDDVVFIELSSSSDVTADVPSFGALAYNSGINSGGSLLDVLTWGFAGGTYTGSATAVQPGTGTAPGNLANPESWHTAALNANFQALAGFGVPRYQKEGVNGGRTRLSGIVQLTANQGQAAVMFTLPVGYRPSTIKSILNAANLSGHTSAVESFQVQPSGDVTLGQGGSNGNYVSLDGVTFEVD